MLPTCATVLQATNTETNTKSGPPYYQGLAANFEPTWGRGPLLVKKHQFEHPGGQHISEPGAFCGPATT